MAGIIWSNFAQTYDEMYEKVWQACFLFTGNEKVADDHCFRAFLVLGATKNADSDLENAACVLGHAAGELARRYWNKKPHRRLSRRFLEKHPMRFAVTDEVLGFLHLSLNRRILSVLSSWGISGDALRQAVGARFTTGKPVPVPDMGEIAPDPELKHAMKDKIYLRFAERSVAVENKIHAAGRTFEKIAPWLALAVLALFAFAYYYVETLH